MRFSWTFALVCAYASWAQVQKFPLVDVQVSGNQTLPAAGIIATAGLRLGQAAAVTDFDSGAKRLFETGMFSSVNYRYDPKTVNNTAGYALTWQVRESAANDNVRLDFPGIEEQELWKEMKNANALVDLRMPANAAAVEYYRRTIQEALRKRGREEEIITKNEADLATGASWTVFRPANLPRISGVRFEGNTSISSNSLQGVLTQASFLGQEYSEHDVRHLLEVNLKPMFEELGHLTVKFPKVALDSGTVMVAIEEGRVWTLGKVEIAGDSIPVEEMQKTANFAQGKLANWKEFLIAISRARTVLSRDGYLAAKATPVSSYQGDTGIVNVTVRVEKGRQFLFGALELNGLSPADRQTAQSLWTLASGSPMNGPYVEDYLRTLLRSLNGSYKKGINTEMRPRPGTNTIDVAFTFR